MNPTALQNNPNPQLFEFNENLYSLDNLDKSVNKTAVLHELKDLEIFQLYTDDFISIKTVYEYILDKSRNCGLDALTFCKLASQHSKGQLILEEKYLGKIKELIQHIEKSIKGEESFRELTEKIANKFPDTESFFMQHIDHLNLFLSSKHEEMLSLTADKLVEKQAEYCHLKHTFRDFFISLALKKPNPQNIKDYYESDILKQNFGRQDNNPYPLGLFNINWEAGTKDIPVNSMCEFMDELMQFRKNYLCRYSMHKVKQAIEDKIQQINYNLFDTDSITKKTESMVANAKIQPITMSDRCLSLLKTTFMHGTHSAILSNLSQSDMKLIPVGHLIRMGIIPLSGELTEGAVLNERSIKVSEIAGTTLDDNIRVFNYSRSYHSNIAIEKSYLREFLKLSKDKNFFKYNSSAHDCQNWSRSCIAVLRLRLLDEAYFNEIKEELAEGLENLHQSFELFKTTSAYIKSMPKELDPDGTLGYAYHDTYFSYHFEKAEENIANIKKAIDKPLLAIKESDHNITPFPIIFGSTNIHTKWIHEDNLERRTQKFCELGKDIEFLSVNKENKNELYTYLQKHNLENKVTIVDNDTLKESMLLNQLASHYFADFASRKKLAQLTGNTNPLPKLDQVEHTFFEKIWNASMVFADQTWGQ